MPENSDDLYMSEALGEIQKLLWKARDLTIQNNEKAQSYMKLCDDLQKSFDEHVTYAEKNMGKTHLQSFKYDVKKAMEAAKCIFDLDLSQSKPTANSGFFEQYVQSILKTIMTIVNRIIELFSSKKTHPGTLFAEIELKTDEAIECAVNLKLR